MEEKTLIHERNASVKIFDIGESKILVEGVLTDERFFRSYSYSLQQGIDPDTVHRIIVRLVLLTPTGDIFLPADNPPGVFLFSMVLIGRSIFLHFIEGFGKWVIERYFGFLDRLEQFCPPPGIACFGTAVF